MRVVVELYGDLGRHVKDGGKRVELEVEEGTTVGEVLSQLGITESAIWNAALNGRLVYSTDPLADGSDLIVFPPIAGG